MSANSEPQLHPYSLSPTTSAHRGKNFLSPSMLIHEHINSASAVKSGPGRRGFGCLCSTPLPGPCRVSSPSLWPRLDAFSPWLFRLTSMVEADRRRLCPFWRPISSSSFRFVCATDCALTSQLAAAQCWTRPPETHFRLVRNLSQSWKRRPAGPRWLRLRRSDQRLSGVRVRWGERHGRAELCSGGSEPPQHREGPRASGSEVTYAAAKIAANRQEVSLWIETAAPKLYRHY